MAVNIKRSIVVDASSVLVFLMPDEHSEEVDTLFNQYKNGIVRFTSTLLLLFEVVNGLKMAVLRKRISNQYAKERIKEFLDYAIEMKEVNFERVFLLAQKYNLTVYYASYLYLSRKYRVKFLTMDEQLQKLT